MLAKLRNLKIVSSDGLVGFQVLLHLEDCSQFTLEI